MFIEGDFLLQECLYLSIVSIMDDKKKTLKFAEKREKCHGISGNAYITAEFW